MAKKRVLVIGAGFGGLAASALLAKQGFDVTVVEKNEQAGGRARVWKKDGFVYDMGPSWYLMPDVFEKYFAEFGKKPEDLMDLKRLDPSYRIFFGEKEKADITACLGETKKLFESYEKGASARFDEYLEKSSYQYDIAMNEFVYRDYNHIYEFFNRKMVTKGPKLHIFENLDKYIQRFFQDHRIRKTLEYNIVFLGGTPKDSPALYSLMAHVDFNMGVWYPLGGMGELVKAMQKIAEEQGVKFVFNTPVKRIIVEGGEAKGVETDAGNIMADLVLADADYHHVEMGLLDEKFRSYDEKYWEKRKIAPGTFLIYLGLNKKIDGLLHHNLYLLDEWDGHFETIIHDPKWPEEACYYVCCPSKTDPTVAPPGSENLFILVPVAPGLEDTPEIRDKYYNKTIQHLENLIGETIEDAVVVKRIYAHNDFAADYNAYKGTALGLAHTLKQTAIFRPRHRSKKVKKLYYTGHYTHPGIGVPMVIIASQILSEEIVKEHA